MNKNHDYTPDFSNVTIGQSWTGRNRIANFIKALGMIPMPSGTNSRKAQENSIALFCEWEDNKDNQQVKLVKIFPQKQPFKRKPRRHKYEEYIQTILLYYLQNSDKPFTTTSNNFWKSIGVIPSSYKTIPLDEYNSLLPNINSKELKHNLNKFRELVSDCLYRILSQNLKYLKESKLFLINKYIIIVDKNNQHISIDEVDRLKLTSIEIKNMLKKAEKHALGQVYVFDKTLNYERPLKNISDMRLYHRQKEYEEAYKEYINNKYGWLYTYKEISIILQDKHKKEVVSFEQVVDAKKSLNQLLTNSIRNSLQKKDTNLKNKYESEEIWLNDILTNNESIVDLYEADIINENSIIKKRQYVYPPNFLECVEDFIQKEIEL